MCFDLKLFFNNISTYFLETQKVAKNLNLDNIITFQYFQRTNNVCLCGINEAVNLIKMVDKSIEVYALKDGDIINNNTPVLKLVTTYYKGIIFENTINGILSRQSSIATNCYWVVKYLEPKKKDIIFMADRCDHYINQPNDGYAAYVGGIRLFSSKSEIQKINEKLPLYGSIPHSFIQLNDGDILKSCENYLKFYKKIICLIDYNNNVIDDALKVAKKFRGKITGFRVDTSIKLIDKFFLNNPKYKNFQRSKLKGTNPELIFALRKKLDENNFKKIKIVVSSGFNLKKIKYFEENNVPVDAYGVGRSLLKNICDFTCDAVKNNNTPSAKVGRCEYFDKRLKKINFK
ncbi:nicotinate phosphoribosyltransferase [symbiont of Argiope bruennichi]|uniref:nicotinate phosphoribosyltransferase n=1 Tax=symbiont of Argiope bruennichi TaxID=2810479 RepID=UPI003DA32882